EQGAAMNIQSFAWAIDLNGDGVYSMWENWEAAKWVFRLPGNLLLEGLGHIPYLSSLLGIHASEASGYGSLNGGLASSLSLLIWVVAIASILNLSSRTVVEPDTEEPSRQALIGMGTPATRQITGPQQHAPLEPRVHLPVSRANY